MKALRLLTLAALSLLSLPQSGLADVYYIFHAAALFPVQLEDTTVGGRELIRKKTLDTADVVNLALGRPITTKLDRKTTILAVAKNASNPDGAKLIVYNPTTHLRVATVCTMQAGSLINQRAGAVTNPDKSKGDGLCFGTVSATTLGSPTLNGFLSTGMVASATATNTPTPTGPIIGLKATGMIGPMQFYITDKNNVTEFFDGVLIKGMFTSAGKRIALLIE